MKRTIATIMATALALVMVLSLAACGGGDSDNDGTTSKNKSVSSSAENGEKKLSDSEIKKIVEQALLDEIKSKYSEAQPNSTKYTLANTEKKGNYTYAYGTVTLYDKYGKITTGYSDGSGSFKKSFEVKISKSGSVVDCKIKD